MSVLQSITLTQKNFRIQPIVHAVCGDTGRQLKMVIGDVVYDSGATAELRFTRSDGSYYAIGSLAVDTTDNSFTADITQALTRAGRTDCQLAVTVSSKVVSTFMFAICVQQNPEGETIEQSGVSVQDILDAADSAAQSAAEAAETAATFTIDPTLSISGAAADAAVTGLIADLTGLTHDLELSFTDGKAISDTAGGVNTSSFSSYCNFTPCSGFDKIVVTMPIYTSSQYKGLAFYSGTNASTFVSGVRCNYNTSLSDYSSEVREIAIPATAKYFRTTWFASTEMAYQTNTFSCKLVKTGTLPEAIDAALLTESQNRLNPNTIQNGYYVNLSGSLKTSSDYAVTDFIPVNPGEVMGAIYGSDTRFQMRYVTAYDSTKTAISASGMENAYTYTVPDGIYYIRVSAQPARIMGDRARIAPQPVDVMYQPFFAGKTSLLASLNRTDVQNVLLYPLTKLPSYVLGDLAYRPLGALSKGYVCFVSDDGGADLATYTLPMFISKEVPITCAVMSASEIFESQTSIDVVVDAVTNHGCEIAQHGVKRWDEYDEYGLNRFFDNEAAFFANYGLTAYGAVCPAHNITDLVRAVAGGRYGCVRTGYDNGLHYANYSNGERSNVFGLSSQSAIDGSLSTQCAALDTAYENHWLRVIHFHEYELDAAKKTQLEGIIDYAKSIGMTFITMKDIPNII